MTWHNERFFGDIWEFYEPTVKFSDLKPGDRFRRKGVPLETATIYHKIQHGETNAIFIEEDEAYTHWFDGDETFIKV